MWTEDKACDLTNLLIDKFGKPQYCYFSRAVLHSIERGKKIEGIKYEFQFSFTNDDGSITEFQASNASGYFGPYTKHWWEAVASRHHPSQASKAPSTSIKLGIPENSTPAELLAEFVEANDAISVEYISLHEQYTSKKALEEKKNRRNLYRMLCKGGLHPELLRWEYDCNEHVPHGQLTLKILTAIGTVDVVVTLAPTLENDKAKAYLFSKQLKLGALKWTLPDFGAPRGLGGSVPRTEDIERFKQHGSHAVRDAFAKWFVAD